MLIPGSPMAVPFYMKGVYDAGCGFLLDKSSMPLYKFTWPNMYFRYSYHVKCIYYCLF